MEKQTVYGLIPVGTIFKAKDPNFYDEFLVLFKKEHTGGVDPKNCYWAVDQETGECHKIKKSTKVFTLENMEAVQ